MKSQMITALILSLIAAFANIFGGLLAVVFKVQQKTLRHFISVSAGFILAVTLLDLYPEVIKGLDNAPLFILIGFVALFFLENFFAVHTHAGKCKHEHTLMGKQFQEDHLEKSMVIIALFGFLIHTFFDGAAIAARILASPVGGFLVFMAVLSHKVPEGFSMASLFQAGRFKRWTSFLSAVALGVVTVIGAMVVYFIQQSEYSLIFLALATGSFTYIVMVELIPYVSGTKDKKGVVFFILGIALFYVTSSLLAHLGFE